MKTILGYLVAVISILFVWSNSSYAQSPPTFKGGILQIWNRVQGMAPQSSFMMRHLRLKGGGAPSKDVSYFFQTEYFPAGLSLLDGFMDVAFGKMMTLRVGQFKYRYGQDRMRDIGDLRTGDYSSVATRAFFPGSSRDIGVSWIYKSQFDFHLAVIGGAGPNVTTDTNASQDIAMMFEVPQSLFGKDPMGKGAGRFGISLYHGLGSGTGFTSNQTWYGAHVRGSTIENNFDYWLEWNNRSDGLSGVSSQLEHRFWRGMSWLVQADGTNVNMQEYRAGFNLPFQEKTRLGAFAYFTRAAGASAFSRTGIIVLDTRF